LEKAFEKDKSIVTEIRAQRFMQEVDEHLDQYLVRETPLILSGEVKDLAYFRKITHHSKKIGGDLKGSYVSLNPKELGTLAWPVMITWLNESEDKIIKEFKELAPGRAAAGLENSWKAVVEGQGLKLLVERDFDCPAFLDMDGFTLYRRPPKTKHRVISDAVDDLIEKAFQMKTQVIFVQNDKLRDYQRVAVIKRY
jgi:hypothetical protein